MGSPLTSFYFMKQRLPGWSASGLGLFYRVLVLFRSHDGLFSVGFFRLMGNLRQAVVARPDPDLKGIRAAFGQRDRTAFPQSMP